MHAAEQLLVRTVGMLDLVVHGPVMLSGETAFAAIMGMSLAAMAGASQLFSP